jgi:hypothetical protein
MVRRIVGYCLEPGVVRRSLIVAVLVGALLNLINQGDALLSGRAIDWAKALLTFTVPYCVATYGAVSYRLRHEHDLARSRHVLHPSESSPGRSGGADA